MNNKVKIIMAIVLFVVAIGAIGYYLTTSRSKVNPDFTRPGSTTPALPDDVQNVVE